MSVVSSPVLSLCFGLVAASCTFDSSNVFNLDGDGSIDASIADSGDLPADATPNAPDAETQPDADVCPFDDLAICASGDHDEPWNITDEQVFLTTSMEGSPCRTIIHGGQEVCLMYVNSFSIGSNGVLRVTGERPLLIASLGNIEILGTFDAASKSSDDGLVGAGANSGDCAEITLPEVNGGGAGGGAGGSFQGKGGDGGAGRMSTSNPQEGGTAGDSLVLPITLRGGCPGSDGGNDGSNIGGEGGQSGGAVSFISLSNFVVNAPGAGVIANGASGKGGARRAGGGGGGTGGMIRIEANNIRILNGTILTEGGAGGEGGTFTTAGTAGTDADFSSYSLGGAGSGAGNGGNGQHDDNTAAQAGNSANRGGGGGGAGSGYILIKGNVEDVNSSFIPSFTSIK